MAHKARHYKKPCIPVAQQAASNSLIVPFLAYCGRQGISVADACDIMEINYRPIINWTNGKTKCLDPYYQQRIKEFIK